MNTRQTLIHKLYSVPDNDYESFINIELQSIKDRRKKKEEELKAEEERKAAEEKERRMSRIETDDNRRYKYDVFFSYSRQDAPIVRRVYQYLVNAGYQCWLDMDELASGNFAQQIIATIQESRNLLFFNSEYSNKSEWVGREIDFAVKNNKGIIPVRLDESPIRQELAMYQFVQYSSDYFDVFMNKIIDYLNHN